MTDPSHEHSNRSEDLTSWTRSDPFPRRPLRGGGAGGARPRRAAEAVSARGRGRFRPAVRRHLGRGSSASRSGSCATRRRPRRSCQEAFLEIWRTAAGSTRQGQCPRLAAHHRPPQGGRPGPLRRGVHPARHDVPPQEPTGRARHDRRSRPGLDRGPPGPQQRWQSLTARPARGSGAGLLRGLHAHRSGDHARPPGRHRQDPHPRRTDPAARRDGSRRMNAATSTPCPAPMPSTRSTTSSGPASSATSPTAASARPRSTASARPRPCWPSSPPWPPPARCASRSWPTSSHGPPAAAGASAVGRRPASRSTAVGDRAARRARVAAAGLVAAAAVVARRCGRCRLAALATTAPRAAERSPSQVLDAPTPCASRRARPAAARPRSSRSRVPEQDRRDRPGPAGAPDGQIYQLWLQHAQQGMVKAGLMPTPRSATVVLDGDSRTPSAPGSPSSPRVAPTCPTTEPIALFELRERLMTRTRSRPRRVAIVGSGVAGLTAAYVASQTAKVTLFEADDRLGGHADTHEVDRPRRRELGIDTGFIVHNERTYPALLRLFAELGVATQPSEMSMSVRDDAHRPGVGRRARSRAASSRPPRNLARPALPADAHRDPPLPPPRQAPARRRRRPAERRRPCGEFLAEGGFSPYFRRHFMEPLVAAVWSCDPEVALDYPARYLFSVPRSTTACSRIFGSPHLAHRHRRLARVRRAAWPPGSTTSALGTKVTSVARDRRRGRGHRRQRQRHDVRRRRRRHPPGPGARHARRADRRCSASCSARCRTPPTPRCCTPTPRCCRGTASARASWNFRATRRGDRATVTVTYDLTRLQRLDTDDPLPRHPRRRATWSTRRP